MGSGIARFWAILGAYDLAISQLLPGSLANQAPRALSLFVVMPLWSWLLIFLLILLGGAIEYAVARRPLSSGNTGVAPSSIGIAQPALPLGPEVRTDSDTDGDLISLLELFSQFVSSPKWDIENTSQIFDWIKAFREAAHRRRFQVWGRRKKTMFQDEVIAQKISHTYWVDASIDETKLASATMNDEVETYGISIRRRWRTPTFFDLEVERVPALKWAKKEAAKYKGEMDKRSMLR